MSSAPAELAFFLVTCGISAFANLCQDALTRAQTATLAPPISAIEPILHIHLIERGTTVTTASPATVSKPPFAPSTANLSPFPERALFSESSNTSLIFFLLAMLLIMALSSAAFMRSMGFRGLPEEEFYEAALEDDIINDEPARLEERGARRQTTSKSLARGASPQSLDFSRITSVDTKPTAHQDKVHYSFSDIVSTELLQSQPQSASPQNLGFSSIAAIDTKPTPHLDDTRYSFSDIVSPELAPIPLHIKSPNKLAFSEVSTVIDLDNQSSANGRSFGEANIEEDSPASTTILPEAYQSEAAEESEDYSTMRTPLNTTDAASADTTTAKEVSPDDQVLGTDVEIAWANQGLEIESFEQRIAQAEAEMSDSSKDATLDDESSSNVTSESAMAEVQALKVGQSPPEIRRLSAEEARANFRSRVAYPLSPASAVPEQAQAPDVEGPGAMSVSGPHSDGVGSEEAQHDEENFHPRGERFWMGKELARRLAAAEDDDERAEIQARADAKRRAEKQKPKNIRKQQERHKKQNEKKKQERKERQMAKQEAEKEAGEE